MRKYIFSIATAALLFTSGVFAQQTDSLLHRQMELEREFNPTLQDADKISSLPALREPVVKKSNTAYSTWSGRTNPPLEIALSRPGDIMSAIPFDLKKGYLSLQAGNYANINGALGYRFIDDEGQKLNLFLLHNSTNGDINYLQETTPGSNKAYLMNNAGQISYSQLLDLFKVEMQAGYTHSLFNYYGNSFDKMRVFDNEKQSLGIFHANMGVASRENENINYSGRLNFQNFHTKFGDLVSEPGIGGNEIALLVDVNKPFFAEDNKIGLSARGVGVFYNDDNVPYHNLQHVTTSPYVVFSGDRWSARLGGNIDLLFNEENKSYFSPNIRLSYSITDLSSLYANFKGGVENNSYLSVMKESRYIQPMLAIKPTYTPLDIVSGVKIGEADGFRLDIFGGLKKSEDAHFLVLAETPMAASSAPYAEYLSPLYGNLTHSHFGATVQTAIWAPLDVSLDIKKHFYDVKDAHYRDYKIADAKAYNQPDLELDVRAAFELTTNLKFRLNYYLATGRWTMWKGENIKMKDINDLNFGGTYQISDALSVQLNAHNLLFQKYDIWYAHPAQGLNIMGGFTFKF